MNDKELVNPFPELVDPRRRATATWAVHATKGASRVDKRNRVLYLSEQNRREAAKHELGHIAWSPVNVPQTAYHPMILQAVEDARINLGLERVGVPMQTEPEAVQDIADLFDAGIGDPLATIVRALACACDSDEVRALGRSALDRLDDRDATRIGHQWMDRLPITLRGQRGTPVQPFTVAVQESERLAADLKRWAESQRQQQSQPQQSEAGVKTVSLASEGDDQEANAKGSGDQEGDVGAEPGDDAGRGSVTGKYKSDEERIDIAEKPPAPMSDALRRAREESSRVLGRPGRADLSKPVASAAFGRLDPNKVREITARRDGRAARSLAEARLREVESRSAAARYAAATSRRHFGNGGVEESGLLDIEEPALVVPQLAAAAAAARLPRSSTEGSMIRRPDRYLIDGAIFARLGKRSGATVLLDQSGSMSVSPEETEALCVAAGRGATVATYSGDSGQGVLRIVARGSTRARPEAFMPYSGGNCVDGAALVWLSRQTGRLVWVSDGRVTDRNDRITREILAACEAVRERAGIIRVHTIGAALALLAMKRA